MSAAHAPPATVAQASAIEMANAFAEEAASCVVREDTQHPAFHGCVDWHSAAHATWALAAHRRLTGDGAHADLVAATLDREALAAEVRDLSALPLFELPYGRAWFLKLEQEWRAGGGDDRLDVLGDLIADSLVAHYRVNPPDPTARDYQSASWALLNLSWRARARGDRETEAFVIELTRTHFAVTDRTCDLAAEGRGFLSVCVSWAWLALEALPREEFRAWFAAWDPGLAGLEPVTPTRPHDFGKNFSRAWGLKALAQATGDARFTDAYERHLAAGYADWTRTRGDYMAVGHWVAQFGMLALDPTPPS